MRLLLQKRSRFEEFCNKLVRGESLQTGGEDPGLKGNSLTDSKLTARCEEVEVWNDLCISCHGG